MRASGGCRRRACARRAKEKVKARAAVIAACEWRGWASPQASRTRPLHLHLGPERPSPKQRRVPAQVPPVFSSAADLGVIVRWQRGSQAVAHACSLPPPPCSPSMQGAVHTSGREVYLRSVRQRLCVEIAVAATTWNYCQIYVPCRLLVWGRATHSSRLRRIILRGPRLHLASGRC